MSESVEAGLTAAVARAVRASESNVGFVTAESFFQEAVCPATLTPLLMSSPEMAPQLVEKARSAPGNGARANAAAKPALSTGKLEKAPQRLKSLDSRPEIAPVGGKRAPPVSTKSADRVGRGRRFPAALSIFNFSLFAREPSRLL